MNGIACGPIWFATLVMAASTESAMNDAALSLTSTLIGWTEGATVTLLLTALLLCLLRLGRGPTLADRVIALDLIAVITVGLILVDAVRSDQAPYLRPALLLGLLGFLATVAFGYHLKHRSSGSNEAVEPQSNSQTPKRPSPSSQSSKRQSSKRQSREKE